MQRNNQARSVLFRAQLGEEPIPTPAMIDKARADLAHDAATCAALDTFVDLIVAAEPLPSEEWRNRLQAYIAAQLAGRADPTEFADVRQALDRSVALAEEYDLLYAVMAHEAQGTLPAPPPPPVRLDFLPTVTPRPNTVEKRSVRQRRSYGLGFMAGFPALLPTYWFGRLTSATTLLIVVGALMGGFWLTRQAPATSPTLDSPITMPQTQSAQPSFFDQQIQFEDTPVPSFTSGQAEQDPQMAFPCLAGRQIGPIRRGCPV